MGYCMQQIDSDFSMPMANKAPALEALHEYIRTKYSSLPSNASSRFRSDIKDNFEDQMFSFGWGIETCDSNVTGIYFDGDRYGNDEAIFDTIAKYVDENSYIDMMGEDGFIWRWHFNGTQCNEYAGEISFPGCPLCH